MSAPDLSHRDELRVIARRAMLARGLEPDFPPAAMSQAAALSSPARDSDAGIRDQRSLLWCSIDNDDSMDLDQLSVCAPAADGAVKILVAIADVDALVQLDSALDVHARINTTSVYTVGRIFPMLPEKLSTDLTSLADGQERLALVIEMTVDAKGALGTCDVYRSRVVNRAKLAYDSVGAWLEDRGPMPARIGAVPGMAEQLRIQDRVAQLLKQVRQGQGSLRLDPLEPQAIFTGDVLTDLKPLERNRAKDLIEDFMIAANGVVARFLAGRGVAAIRRVLRTPEHWDRIVALAAEAGGELPRAPDAAALSEFLKRQHEHDPDHFADLSLAVVKLLGTGQYVMEQPGQAVEGHFALAVRDYAHSTAPNRRYPDLITQRLIKATLAGRPSPYVPQQLEGLAAHCTLQEHNAEKIERQVRKSAAAMLLEPRVGESFDAVVTGATVQGTWVRISAPIAEGKLVHGAAGLAVGDRVRVTLVQTDVARGFIDFVRAR